MGKRKTLAKFVIFIFLTAIYLASDATSVIQDTSSHRSEIFKYSKNLPVIYLLQANEVKLSFLTEPYTSSSNENSRTIFNKLNDKKISERSTSGKSSWYAFNLQNNSRDSVWLLSLDEPDVKIRLFEKVFQKTDSLVEIPNAGMLKNLEINGHWGALFKLTIRRGATYLLNLDYSSASPRANIGLASIRIAEAKNREKPDPWLYGLSVGTILAVILLLSFFYWATREAVHLVFLLYFITTATFVLAPLSLIVQLRWLWFCVFTLKPLLLYVLYPLLIHQSFRNSKYLTFWVLFAILCSFTQKYYMNSNSMLYPYKFIPWLSIDVFFTFSIFEKIAQRAKPVPYLSLALIVVAVNMASKIVICFSLPGSVYMLSSIKIFSLYIPQFFSVCILICCLAMLIFRYLMFIKEERATEITNALNAQQSLSEDVICALESDRKRIAEDIHDELGGNLAAVKLAIEADLPVTERSQLLLAIINNTANAVRNISHNLMPPEFESRSISDILSDYFSQLNADSKIRFSYYSKGKNNRFNKTDYLIIYRIIMELVNNISKHANATEAMVQLVYYDDLLEIMVEDNGIGFPDSPGNGIGLTNVRSRVNYMAGEWYLDTNTNGTTIIIKLPYQK